MKKYLLKRLLRLIPVFLGVTGLTVHPCDYYEIKKQMIIWQKSRKCGFSALSAL